MKPLDVRTSYSMSRVRQKRTAPEDRVASLLREMGLHYRRNVRSLSGSPDFVNRARGWVIHVHGCFWHQHDCKRATMPAHNRGEWQAKFARTKARDSAVDQLLRARGLRVITVWECETKGYGQFERTAHLPPTVGNHAITHNY
jgi:DNA mismatch endonuclease, patch repair protein